jgi:arylsulfatase A-like enzyme
MKKTNLYLFFLILSVSFMTSLVSCSNQEKKTEKQTVQKPNIIFFIADDMERDMFNCLPEGKDSNLSPNLDKLVDEGIVMINQHVSSSVCTPSRFSCLTGTYASRATCKEFTDFTKKMDGQTVVQWNTYITPEDMTIGKLMKKLGYTTGFYGKNHAVEAPGWKKLPLDTDPTAPEAVKVLKHNAEIIRRELKKAGFDYAGANYQDNPSYLGPEKLRVQNLDWITDESLKFLEEVKDKPFFLYYATTVPHGPSNAKQSWNGDRRVTAEDILDTPPTCLPPKETIPERIYASGLVKKGEKIPDRLGNVLWIDDALGALIRKLKEQGKLDNTIIFFFSDHGQYAKGSIYEGGVSAPSIVWQKGGFKAGHLSKALVSNIDFAPTIFDMAGGNPDTVRTFDGKSFMPILNGEKDEIHNSLYFEMGFSRGVLKDSFKYIALRYPKFAMEWDLKKRKKILDKWNNFRIANKLRYHYTDPSLPFSHLMLIPGGGDAEFPSTKRYKHYYETDQLYDLRNDPHEQNNLFGDPEYADKVKELQEELVKYLNTLPGRFGEFKTEEEIITKK